MSGMVPCDACHRIAQFLQQKFGEDRNGGRHGWAARVDELKAKDLGETAGTYDLDEHRQIIQIEHLISP
jgi:hypothetical protein